MKAPRALQMTAGIARRDFIAALGGTALWPVRVRAQQRTMPVVGFLGLTTPEAFADQVTAFRRGLGESGYVEGQNVAVEYRWAHGQFGQLQLLASELVQRQVTVIAALGTPASGLAAKAATTTIPVVFVTGGDPVELGLVKSLNRPDGNATGVFMLTTALEPKRLELLHELVPRAAIIAVLVDPNSPETEVQTKELSAAAVALKQKIVFLNAGSESEIEAAFTAAAEQRMGGLLITSAPFFLRGVKNL